MTDKTISFDMFEFPVKKGLEYLVNEKMPESDFLFINDQNESFSVMFEKGFPIFTVPENSERNYCLLEFRRSDRTIKLFCPEKRENIDTAVWYFYVELADGGGEMHTLPGQVRVEFEGELLKKPKGKPKFIELLEEVKLKPTVSV